MDGYTPTMGSLFSGIGGFEAAAQWHGAKVLWQSEIEPWAVQLLQKRFPDAKQLGDIARISGSEIPHVDFITFGSPCQDMSVAGKRAGLDGERSGLFRQATRIIKEMREATNGEYPKFAIWENVPGAFTSNKGFDFRAVLEEITEAEIPMPASGRWATAGMVRGGKCDVSWRTLDAQYWGTPQRRKRIYLVADYRAERSAEILFKPESVSRHPAPCGKPREGAAADTEGGIGASGNSVKVFLICSYTSNSMKSDNPNSGIYETEKSSTLDLNGGNPVCNQGGVMVCVPIVAIMLEAHPNDSRIKVDESGSCQTLTGRMGTGGGNVPLIMEPIATLDCRNMTVNDDLSGTLQAKGNGGHSLNYQNPILLPVFCLQGSMICRTDKNGPQGDGVNKDICFTLNTADRHAVVYAIDRAAFNQGKNAQFNISIKDDGIVQTVVAKGPNAIGVPIVTMNERQYALTVSEDIANTLTSTDYKGVQLADIPIAVFQGQASPRAEVSYSESISPTIQCTKQVDILTLTPAKLTYIVRRLTPSECAKLQGFPADWHEGVVNEKGKAMPDTAAYKGYGNAVATVCAEYPIANIIKILKEENNS